MLPMKPERNLLIKKYGVDHYREELAKYIHDTNNFTAKIDHLKLLLKLGEYDSFRKKYHELRKQSSSPILMRELAKYCLFVEKDYIRAKKVLQKVSSRDASQPAWVHYFSGKRVPYFEKLCNGLLYTAIPKNASTSLKTFIIKEVLKQEGVNPHSVFGNPFFKHNIYTPEVVDTSKKVAVIRQPEKRFFSYYTKNILSENSLAFEYGVHNTDCEELFGLKLKPSLDEFIANFDRYCLIFNDVFHHTLPQAAYVGDLSKYDYVCDVSEVDSLVAYVAGCLNIDSSASVKAPKEMVGNSVKIEVSDFAAKKVKSFYSDDYDVLSFAYENHSITNKIKSYSSANNIYSFLEN